MASPDIGQPVTGRKASIIEASRRMRRATSFPIPYRPLASNAVTDDRNQRSRGRNVPAAELPEM